MKNREYPYYDVPQMSDLKDMINRNAAEKPDQTAFMYPIETGEMKKSFLNLKEDVEAFGTWMYQKKIKNKHVVILGENSYEWIVTFLATVNGGNTAVAIDKGLPVEEVKELAATAEAEIAFVSDTPRLWAHKAQ